MTILQVLYMVEVARRGSMSKAAEVLGVSQPALSLQIKRLEEELDCKLFHREAQGVSLTVAGAAFYEEALPAVESWERLQEKAGQLKEEPGQVRIGVGARAISNGLFEAVSAFFERHPETEVTFITDLGEDTLEALAGQKIDLALDRMPPRELIRRPELFSSVELLRERQCILLSTRDPRASLSELPFGALGGGAFISGPRDSLDDLIMNQNCRRFGVRFSRIYRADNIDAVMSLIRDGRGAALGPSSFAQRYGVAAVPMLPESDAVLHLICLKQNRNNPLFVRMEEYLKDYVAKP